MQCPEARFYADFLARLGLAGDARFARQYDPAAWAPARAGLAAIFAPLPRAHWAAVFQGSEACVAPVLSPGESAQDPHMAARGVWAADPLQPAPAPCYVGEGVPAPAAPRPRDADRAAILAELGLGA